MKVAEVVIRGGLALEMRAFRWLRDTWLPASGYLPTDLPAFEAWLGLPMHMVPSISNWHVRFPSASQRRRADGINATFDGTSPF